MSEFKPKNNETALRGVLIPSGIDEDYEYSRVYNELKVGETYSDQEAFQEETKKPKRLWASLKKITFSTFSRKRVVISDDGRIGIGEESPNSLLHLGSKLTFEDFDSDGYFIDGYTDGYGGHYHEGGEPLHPAEDVYITFKDSGRIGCDFESDDLIFESYGKPNIRIKGGICLSIRKISSDYNIDSSERKDYTILADTASSVGNINITLPDDPAKGRVLIIKDIGTASINNINIISSDKIDGQLTGVAFMLHLDSDKESIKLVWDGTDSWWTMCCGEDGSGADSDHESGIGNNSHIPEEGLPGQFLSYDGSWATPADVLDTWRAVNDTPVDGAVAISISSNWAHDHEANDTHLPAAGNPGEFLAHDSDWAAPPDTTYTVGDGGLTQNNFTDSLKVKLDGIEDSATADQTKADIDALNIDAATVSGNTVGTSVPGGALFTDTTYTVGDGGLTQNNFTDPLKVKLDGIEDNATAVGGASGVDFNDSVKARFGGGNDLEIYHNGNNSFVSDQGTGGLYVLSNDAHWKSSDSATSFARFRDNGGVELYQGGDLKLQTVSGGVTVTGTITADGIDLADDVKARFGTGNDLEIYHDGSNSYIEDVGDGALKLKTSQLQVHGSNGEVMIKATKNSDVELYHNNLIKLETTSDGVTITGSISSDGLSGTQQLEGILLRYVGVNSDYTIDTDVSGLNDYIVGVDTTGGEVEITLPAAPSQGRTLVIKDSESNSQTNKITVLPNVGHNVDGSNQLDIISDKGCATIVFDGVDKWIIIGMV